MQSVQKPIRELTCCGALAAVFRRFRMGSKVGTDALAETQKRHFSDRSKIAV